MMRTPTTTSTAMKVHFEVAAEPGSRVYVAGTFNAWNPTSTPLCDNQHTGHFRTGLHVPPGMHEYKFVVNGVWTVDPQCAKTTPNAFGSQNSVIQV
jgi:1,4-alpha-glucan branching enzyme